MVTRVIYVKLSFVENAKKKVKNRHTWLTIPAKCVHQISETNILVYCTDFVLYEKIRKHKVCYTLLKYADFDNFQNVEKMGI